MKNERGFCPRCGQKITDYEILKISNGMLFYPFVCPNCGLKGKEWYDLKFTHFTDMEGRVLDNEVDAKTTTFLYCEKCNTMTKYTKEKDEWCCTLCNSKAVV